MDGPQHGRLRRLHRAPRSRRQSGSWRRQPDHVRRSQRREPFGHPVQTSDQTWEAYNDYGGNSLYTCTIDCPSGNPLAYKGAAAVSYNRPLDGDLKTDSGESDPYYAEQQMIYWLEENGYDVSYTDGGTVDSTGALLKNHKVFVSSGHDEYWSPGQRANVAAALSAGVNLAFFSGNEMFWKTRWGPSIDGSSTAYRTLTSYKETHYNAQVDPQDPPTWTGSWADPRFQSAWRRRQAGQRADRPAVPGELRDARSNGPRSVRQAPLLAQHGGCQPHLRPDADARAGPGNSRLRVGRGRGQRLPAQRGSSTCRPPPAAGSRRSPTTAAC